MLVLVRMRILSNICLSLLLLSLLLLRVNASEGDMSYEFRSCFLPCREQQRCAVRDKALTTATTTPTTTTPTVTTTTTTTAASTATTTTTTTTPTIPPTSRGTTGTTSMIDELLGLSSSLSLAMATTCVEDCHYACMDKAEKSRRSRGLGPSKYYGHWPFPKVMNMQEPASVLFSLFNMVPHLLAACRILRGSFSTS